MIFPVIVSGAKIPNGSTIFEMMDITVRLVNTCFNKWLFSKFILTVNASSTGSHELLWNLTNILPMGNGRLPAVDGLLGAFLVLP